VGNQIGEEIANHPIVKEHALLMELPEQQEVFGEPLYHEGLQRDVAVVLPTLDHADQGAPCCHSMRDLMKRGPRLSTSAVDLNVATIALGVADDDAAVSASEPDSDLDRDGSNGTMTIVTIGAHDRARIGHDSASLTSCITGIGDFPIAAESESKHRQAGGTEHRHREAARSEFFAPEPMTMRSRFRSYGRSSAC
jgi:hypothetical protein